MILLLSVLPGCTVVDVGVRNPVPGLESVAVAPFFNLSQERTVDGREFALAYYSELQKVPGFEVLPVGVAERAMIDNGLTMENPNDALELARILGVDAVVIGAVTDYDPYSPRVGLKVAWYSPKQWLFLPNQPADKLKLVELSDTAPPTILRAQSPAEAASSPAVPAGSVPVINEGDWETLEARAGSQPTATIPPAPVVTDETPDHSEFLPPRPASDSSDLPSPISATAGPTDSTLPVEKPAFSRPQWTQRNASISPVPMRIAQQPASEIAASEAASAGTAPPPTTGPSLDSALDAATSPATPENPPLLTSPPSGAPVIGVPNLSRSGKTSMWPNPDASPPTLLFASPTDTTAAGLAPEMDEQTVPVLIVDDHIVLGRDEFNPQEPLMAYVRMFDSTDARLVARLADYLELSGETRSGDLEAYMKRSDFFRKFTAHVMISEMLMLHGGESRRRFLLKQRRYK
jgi:hypothetical protein